MALVIVMLTQLVLLIGIPHAAYSSPVVWLVTLIHALGGIFMNFDFNLGVVIENAVAIQISMATGVIYVIGMSLAIGDDYASSFFWVGVAVATSLAYHLARDLNWVDLP